MTVGDLKKILEASPDDTDEVYISGPDHNHEPEDIEYVMTFPHGEVWIVSNIITMKEVKR